MRPSDETIRYCFNGGVHLRDVRDGVHLHDDDGVRPHDDARPHVHGGVRVHLRDVRACDLHRVRGSGQVLPHGDGGRLLLRDDVRDPYV